MRALGLGPFAEAVGQDLLSETRRAFADRIGPGPRLVVRVTGISLNAYAGGQGGRGRLGGGTSSDDLEGEALVVGPRSEVVRRHPQLSVTPASSGGAWYDPASERRRVTALAGHHAQWLRRAL